MDNLNDLLRSNNAEAILAAAREFLNSNRRADAAACYRRLVELNSNDIESRFICAHLVDDGSHKGLAQARDLALALLDDFPAIFEYAQDGNCALIRFAATRCGQVGPLDKAVELLRRLAPLSGAAADYFALSEILAGSGELQESIEALEKAISLAPVIYDTVANRETLRIGKANPATTATASKSSERKGVARYPQTKDFHGNLKDLIKNHIAADLKKQSKFIRKSTQFFTMGSCFARNISVSLNKSGYLSTHMEISEYINTTYANRALVDWLSGRETDASVISRINELLPAGWTAESTLAKIRSTDVFILTLGVAPAFFDRATGNFVLPRPTSLNSRVLAEKYQYRTTSVQENVDNVLYLIDFIRMLSPKVKIVITVSPVPLLASFEFESCVSADCLSKSTMRLTAHEIVNNSGLENIIYWPSFEVFRWGGSNASDFYAADDGAAWHVSESKVNSTMEAFIDIFTEIS